jgi:16S rRNA (adenine1518-N6/adenine1519-N6)-dimethyltransferase
MPPIRQTQSYLRSLFAENGISPQRRLGQNFLIDLNIHDLIVKTAELSAGDVILEIGPGAGALASLIAPSVAAVVAVEVDPAMARLTARATAGSGNVQVVNLDALAGKNTINPAVLDHVRGALATGDGRRFKLVANLPYHVATPVITNFLVHPELCPELLVVTIQREMADRLCATAATPAYGAVSVVVQALAEVSLVRTLPPSAFWPRPKVDSAVVTIRPRPQKRAEIGDVAGFHTLVRRTFQHRRKYLRHVLAGMWPDVWNKADVDRWLESMGQSGQIRAEALGIEEFVSLAHGLRERFGLLPPDRLGSAGKPRYERDDDDQDEILEVEQEQEQE